MEGVSNYPSNKQMSVHRRQQHHAAVQRRLTQGAVHRLLYSRGSNLGGFSAAMMVSAGAGDAGWRQAALASWRDGNKEPLKFFSCYFLLKEELQFRRHSELKELYRDGPLAASFDHRLNPRPLQSHGKCFCAVLPARMAPAGHLVTTVTCQLAFIITNRHRRTQRLCVCHSRYWLRPPPKTGQRCCSWVSFSTAQPVNVPPPPRRRHQIQTKPFHPRLKGAEVWKALS